MVITRGLRGGKMGGYCLIETKFEFWWWKEFCSWMMVMVAQPCECASAQLSRSVVSDSLWPHELLHARPPYHHQLPEFTRTHVHQVSDAIRPSHPLSVVPFSCPQSLPKWNDTNELTKQKETNRLRKQIYGYQRGGTVREFGKVMYTPLYSKWITNKDLLYITRNSTQSYVVACMGVGFGEE